MLIITNEMDGEKYAFHGEKTRAIQWVENHLDLSKKWWVETPREYGERTTLSFLFVDGAIVDCL